METLGIVVKLDRGFPLVRCHDAAGRSDGAVPNNADSRDDGDGGTLVRCEHATALMKGERMRATVGDEVEVSIPSGHDKGVITAIMRRRTAFVRRDPAERTAKQVLAANFDRVIVVEPIVQLNMRRLERELVLAHETGATVSIVLSKADLMETTERERTIAAASDLAGHDVNVLAASVHERETINRVRKLVPTGTVAILIGKSGVGKSTLVNHLAGGALQGTGTVRAHDGKGRHTTVDRVMIDLPNGGAVVDMPGVRGLGLWDADQGLSLAFADVERVAAACRFRDCSHGDEPGCAVREAVNSGEMAATRLDSYRSLAREIEQVRARRDEARHIRGEKASDRRKHRKR